LVLEGLIFKFKEGVLSNRRSNYTLPHLSACCWIWNNTDPEQCWRSAKPNSTLIHVLRCGVHGLTERAWFWPQHSLDWTQFH